MHIAIPILIDFFKDFELPAAKSALVCFAAMIEFKSEGISKTFDTDIEIINTDKPGDTILHLLNPEITRQRIPDTIRYDAGSFAYIKHKALLIIGEMNRFGQYSITIKPSARRLP